METGSHESVGEFPSTTREVEALLREPDHRFQFLFQEIPGALWATDAALRLVYVMGRLRVGIDDDEFLGLTVPEIAERYDADQQIVVAHATALSGRSTTFQYGFRHRIFEVGIEPLWNNEGRVVGTLAFALDYTERRLAEQELARSEERLQAAQRAAHVGTWEWEIEPNRVRWSDELARIYGREPGRGPESYEAFLALIHPEDRPHTQNAVLDALRRRSRVTYDHRIVLPDGGIRMLHSRGEVVADKDGKAVSMVGTCWDVTDRWVAEQKVERTVSLLKATLESTADGILVVDTEGRIRAYNERFLALWNVPRERVERRDDRVLLQSVLEQLEDPDAFIRRVEELYRDPSAETLDIVRFLDGRIFERYSLPQRIGSETVGRVWSFRDVTQRERLLATHKLLSDASRLLASLEIDQALEAMARLTLPLLGEGCAIDIFSDENGPRRVASVSRDPARPVTVEIPRPVYGGHSVVFPEERNCLSVPLTMHGSVIGAMTFTCERHCYDDDHVKLAEELAHRAEMAIANARLYQEAQKALAARDEFLSIAAHELRGPLTALRLAVQGIRRVGLSAESAARGLDIIEREERRITRFVDELMDVTRVRKAKLRFEFSEVDWAEVTREVVLRLMPEIRRAGSTFSTSGDASVIGMWDRSRLDQIVMNLVTNAIKYGRGKPIELSLKADGDTATLMVRDHGLGVPRHLQERIFEPFERGISGRHYGGLGLGLYIVRSIVQALGGNLRLESTPGHGSTFIVSLPRSRKP